MACPNCGHENLAGADVCEECQADLTHLDAPEPRTPLEGVIMEQTLASVPGVSAPRVDPETPLREVAERLADGDGAALVVYDDVLIGIFSERDLLMKIGDRFNALADRPIRDFMTPAPETLSGQDPIVFALNRMDVGHFRHIPIEENERPVGMVSTRNILQHLARCDPDSFPSQ